MSHTLESLSLDRDRVQEIGARARTTSSLLSSLGLQVELASDQLRWLAHRGHQVTLTPDQVRLLETEHSDRDLCKYLFSKSKLEWFWCEALGLPIYLINWARIELIRLYLVAFPTNQLTMRQCTSNCRQVTLGNSNAHRSQCKILCDTIGV